MIVKIYCYVAMAGLETCNFYKGSMKIYKVSTSLTLVWTIDIIVYVVYNIYVWINEITVFIITRIYVRLRD